MQQHLKQTEIKSEATILSTYLKGSCKFNSPSLYYLFQSILYTKSKKKKEKKKESKHRTDTHNVVHVGMEDTEKVLLYSLVGIATNIKGYIERRENYAGFKVTPFKVQITFHSYNLKILRNSHPKVR